MLMSHIIQCEVSDADDTTVITVRLPKSQGHGQR